MARTFPVRGLAPDVVDKIDAAAEAEGCSRNAYIVKMLTEHARRIPSPGNPGQLFAGLRLWLQASVTKT